MAFSYNTNKKIYNNPIKNTASKTINPTNKPLSEGEVTPAVSTGTVKVRDYIIKNWAPNNKIDMTDDDITYDNDTGEVYVKGQSVGKPLRINKEGRSFMDETVLSDRLNNLGLNSNSTKPSAQIDRNINTASLSAEKMLKSSENYDKEAADAASRAENFHTQDPTATSYWKKLESIYGGAAENDYRNVLAEAGTGANIDSASIAAGEKAKSVRMMEAVDAYNKWFETASQGISETNKNRESAFNSAISGMERAGVLANNTAGLVSDINTSDVQNKNNQYLTDSAITGKVPLEIEKRNNPYFADDGTGNYVLKDISTDYTETANRLEAMGDSEGANNARIAAYIKAIENPQFRQYLPKLLAPVANNTLEVSEADKTREHDINLQNNSLALENKENVYKNILKAIINEYENKNIDYNEFLSRLTEFMGKQG